MVPLEQRIHRKPYFRTELARSNAVGDLAKRLTEIKIEKIKELLEKGDPLSKHTELNLDRYFSNEDIKTIQKLGSVLKPKAALIFNWYLEDIQKKKWEDYQVCGAYRNYFKRLPPKWEIK